MYKYGKYKMYMIRLSNKRKGYDERPLDSAWRIEGRLVYKSENKDRTEGI